MSVVVEDKKEEQKDKYKSPGRKVTRKPGYCWTCRRDREFVCTTVAGIDIWTCTVCGDRE